MKHLNQYIDHTLLKPEATSAMIEQLCAEAMEHSFWSVCVNSCYVPICAALLADSEVKVTSVVGFPLGAMDTDSKTREASNALEAGADEIDMVVNVGALLDGDDDYVLEDIRSVARVCRENDALLKVILETHFLSGEQLRHACELAMKAGADFVKTSTGFTGGGATEEDVSLMAQCVKGKGYVKASGGVRTREQAEAMIRAGAARIGTSSGISIIES